LGCLVLIKLASTGDATQKKLPLFNNSGLLFYRRKFIYKGLYENKGFCNFQCLKSAFLYYDRD